MPGDGGLCTPESGPRSNLDDVAAPPPIVERPGPLRRARLGHRPAIGPAIDSEAGVQRVDLLPAVLDAADVVHVGVLGIGERAAFPGKVVENQDHVVIVVQDGEHRPAHDGAEGQNRWRTSPDRRAR